MITRVGFICGACVLAGCQSTTRDFQSPIKHPDAWSQLQDQSGIPGVAIPERWWTAFGDSDLDQLIDLALDENFSLRMSWDRLTQARAIARREGADLSPTLDLNGGVSRSRTQTNAGTNHTTDWDLGLLASYEVDLWGRVRSTRDAALLDAMIAEEDVHAAAISLTAEIASRWYEYAELNERIGVIQKQKINNESVLEIITAQFRAAKIRAEDVLRQRNLVESSEGDLSIAMRQAETLRLELLILLGLSPDAHLPVDRPSLVDLPSLPDMGLPSTLLQQRPDVRSAYRGVQAADRRAAAAIADQYPSISLSASVGTTGSRASDLFDNWVANLAGNIVQPLFDGGRREAEVDRTLAVTSEAINNYGQAVLTALHEVETALVQERQQVLYVESLSRQFDTAQKVVERVRDSYLSGQSEYLNVLDAQTSVQQLEIQLLEARRVLINDRVNLFRALAGDWSMESPEQAKFAEVDDAKNSPDIGAVQEQRSGVHQ
ncbi:MAG: efflux transporter outer membrane subunit [Phycisphaerales bacterium]|nr:efflux transporter outer membrane subunit [Phycisphaerales bacterium]